MSSERQSIYLNPDAKNHTQSEVTTAPTAKKSHESLPLYRSSPLVPLDNLAKELRVKSIFVEDEGNRLGLLSFKILGASWETFRAVASKLHLPLVSNLDVFSRAATNSSIKLFATTYGNHGRAVAYMAKLLHLPAEIFVPTAVSSHDWELIADEGAEVTIIQYGHDATILAATQKAATLRDGLLIQDTSFEGYDDIPSLVVDGYSTMLQEVKSQLNKRGVEPTVAITPVSIRPLVAAVVAYAKSGGRSIITLAVEPDTAACLHISLRAGRITPIKTPGAIVTGLDCGTASSAAWPILQHGLDASITVSDFACHQAVLYLVQHGVQLGLCGAAGLAVLRHVAITEPGFIGLVPESVVVILGTERPRSYLADFGASLRLL